MKQHENHAKKTSKKDNKTILWFEVDDTGCGKNLKTCREKTALKTFVPLPKKKKGSGF